MATGKRVAVIGAGPSGLSQLHSFSSAKAKGEDIPEVVCFERQADIGGLWNYTWRTGLDKNGEPVHSSMYRYLFSNGPKECLEFADYSFEEHFGKAIASYPPRPVVYDYLKGRATKSGVIPWIRFETAVRNVTFDESTKKFTVAVHDLKKDEQYSEEFDYVVVAIGHFSVPNAPEFPGFDLFKGRVLHAHDFRDAMEFHGKDILLIGSSYSAEDIGSQCWKYGCKSVTVSHRTAAMGFKWPDNWKEVPLLEKVEGNTCTFKDGSTRDVDAIILCTGYVLSYPFLPDELKLKSGNRMWPLGLYQGVVWEKNPNLFYLGMQDQWFTFNMFDLQAWFARDVILGKQKLPSQEEMEKDSLSWRERELKLETSHDMIVFQADTMKRLQPLVDYPQFDIDGMSDTFYAWKAHKKESIMGFRDNSYKSLITGNPQPRHHTPWVDAKDDSLETYLKVLV